MATEQNNGPSLHGRRLLVVEDEYIVARHLSRLIREMGGEPLGPACDVASAREHLSARAVDAALLDIKLGASSAWPLADELAAQEIPFIFISGYDRGQLPERFADRPLVEKPIKASSLDRTIAQALGTAQPAGS